MNKSKSKGVKSPTGCVHAVDGGNKLEGYMTLCNHRNYYKNFGEGYWHHWPLTDEEVTCKRCLKLMGKGTEDKIMPVEYKFEYKILFSGNYMVYETLEKRLNKLGKERWEVVCKLSDETLLLKKAYKD